jgi:hypothetical protein
MARHRYQLLIYTAWMWSSWLLVGGMLAAVVLLSGALNVRMARQSQRRVQRLTRHSRCGVRCVLFGGRFG